MMKCGLAPIYLFMKPQTHLYQQGLKDDDATI